jgi:adenosine kinase
MDTKKYILGLGNPIIDISGNVEEETLKKFELQMGTTVFCNEKNCGFFDYLESKPEVTYIPGGSVTNSIRVTNVNYFLELLQTKLF